MVNSVTYFALIFKLVETPAGGGGGGGVFGFFLGGHKISNIYLGTPDIPDIFIG